MKCLVKQLLARGDLLTIERGLLIISSKSGRTIPDDWARKHTDSICIKILEATDAKAFQYESYSVGHYGLHRGGGVTLQYSHVLSGKSSHLVFNVELTRGRNTMHGKKGQRLPRKEFRVGKNYSFVKYWKRLGLPLPKRLAAFADCMGKLRSVLITGEIDRNGRIDKSSVRPLEISHTQILEAFGMTKCKPPLN